MNGVTESKFTSGEGGSRGGRDRRRELTFVCVLCLCKEKQRKGSEANMGTCEQLFCMGDYGYRDPRPSIFSLSVLHSVTGNFKRSKKNIMGGGLLYTAPSFPMGGQCEVGGRGE